jgi:hypothetical protein
MATRQMSPRLLASNAGLWVWRVRRHLAPTGFARLGPRLLARYAEALCLPPEELKRVPAEPRRVFTDENLSDGQTDIMAMPSSGARSQGPTS